MPPYEIDDLNLNMANLSVLGSNNLGLNELETSMIGINHESVIPENTMLGTNTDLDTRSCNQMTHTESTNDVVRVCKSPQIDKYSDAKLSGVLERLSASELTVVTTLAELLSTPDNLYMTDITSYNDQLGSNTDHTYAVPEPMLSDHSYCSVKILPLCKQTATGSQCENSPHQIDSVQENTHAEVNENCIIDLAANDLILAPFTSMVDVSEQQEPLSYAAVGINDDREVVSMMGKNSANSDNSDRNKSFTRSNDIQGINPDSSSSEFEGFTPSDICKMCHFSSSSSLSSSDSLLDTSDFDYEVAVMDSTDTISATEEVTCQNVQDGLLLNGQSSDSPIPSVMEIWKRDALHKNWLVPLRRLTRKELYELSNLPHKWDEMHPYSSLEEKEHDSDKQEEIKLDRCKPDKITHNPGQQSHYKMH